MSSKSSSANPSASDFFTSLPVNRQHLLALLFILVLPLVLFDEASFGGQQLMGHDTIQWRAGAESIIEYREAHDGEEPLWATNMFSGMPAYTISLQKSVVHLDNLIGSLFSSIYPVGYYWVLMIGLYIFFQLLKVRPLSSLLGSVFISFMTYMPIILGAGHNNKFKAFVFIPWILIGYWLLTRNEKNKLLSFSVFAIALTLEFRAGHPQVTYYFFYLLGFWWLYDTWQAYKDGRIKPWVTTTAFLAIAGALGLLGNAQQYWTLMEYSPHSIRGGSALADGGGGLGMEYAFNWSQGVGELFTLIIPGLFGGSSAEAYWGPKPPTSGPHYMGAVVFMLLLIGMFRSGNKLKYLFFGVGTLAILFSLGHHFETFNRFMFNYVPYFDKFRTPEMWLIVTIFCFSVVGIFGLEYLIEAAKEKGKHLKSVALPVGAAIGIGLIFALGSSALLSFEKPGERQQYAQQVAQQNNLSPESPQVQQAVSNFIDTSLKPARRDMASSDSTRYLVIILIAAALITALLIGKLSPGYFLIGMILLSSYDLISIGNRYSNEGAMVSENLTPEQVIQQQQRPLDQFLQEQVDSGNGWPYRVFPLGDNPFQNARPSYFYPTIGGYSGAKLSYYQDLIDNLLFTEAGGLNIATLSLLNVKYISYPQQLPFEYLTQVYSGNDGLVYENTEVLPKAFYVDSIHVVSSAAEAIEAMQQEQSFNPSETAIVEGSPAVEISPDTTASVDITHYDSRTLELSTSRDTPGFLVLSEIYYPAGWEVTLDGEPLEVYKTNYVLRGMHVPAGDHTIRMEFNPRSYIWGSRIAWIANIFMWGIGIASVILYFRSEPNASEKSEDG